MNNMNHSEIFELSVLGNYEIEPFFIKKGGYVAISFQTTSIEGDNFIGHDYTIIFKGVRYFIYINWPACNNSEYLELKHDTIYEVPNSPLVREISRNIRNTLSDHDFIFPLSHYKLNLFESGIYIVIAKSWMFKPVLIQSPQEIVSHFLDKDF